MTVPDASTFMTRLEELATDDQREKIQRYFRTGDGEYGAGDEFIGVPMGKVFGLAKEAIDLPLNEIERLLESPIHEARAGACSVMDKRGRRKRTGTEDLAALYGLYRRRIDRINNWDLVDLAAPYVVGRYLFGQPLDTLAGLARSDNVWERRTAIYATSYAIRQGQLEPTLQVAEILVSDPHDLIRKAVGGWLREVGRKDRPALVTFLELHAATMPRTMLWYSVEHHSPEERAGRMRTSV
ncbi:MAG TPA: DNA alkylation repair protein [Thermomicrobiales bacterium]|jgi:3-methyladenine DNA glycosylase AlkD|nr:DNA alkylation repair protein [Thermomicrobiales bacterium]